MFTSAPEGSVGEEEGSGGGSGGCWPAVEAIPNTLSSPTEIGRRVSRWLRWVAVLGTFDKGMEQSFGRINLGTASPGLGLWVSSFLCPQGLELGLLSREGRGDLRWKGRKNEFGCSQLWSTTEGYFAAYADADDGRGLAVGRADRVGGVGEQHGEA